nr:hypothetical protein [Limnochorda pilosa]
MCGADMIGAGSATQVYRKGRMTVTVTGIPAVAVCSRCENAVLEWDVAQAVEDLVQPLLRWAESHTLVEPVVNVVFPVPA